MLLLQKNTVDEVVIVASCEGHYNSNIAAIIAVADSNLKSSLELLSKFVENQ